MACVEGEEVARRQTAHSRRGQPCHQHRRASTGRSRSNRALREGRRPGKCHRWHGLRPGRSRPFTDRLGKTCRSGKRRRTRKQRALGISARTKKTLNVRFWHKADTSTRSRNVRFRENSGHHKVRTNGYKVTRLEALAVIDRHLVITIIEWVYLVLRPAPSAMLASDTGF